MTQFKILSINKMGQVEEMDDLGRGWNSVLEALQEIVGEEGWEVVTTLYFDDSTDLYLKKATFDFRTPHPTLIDQEN